VSGPCLRSQHTNIITLKASSHDLILSQIRDLICNGKLKQGAKIPTRSELAQYFSVSQSTVQKAMVNLEEDGFVESHGKKGSFISKTPPHIYRYAFAFPFSPNHLNWGTAYETILRVLEDLKRQGSDYWLYHGEDEKTLSRLTDDLKHRRVAGALCLGSHENYLNIIHSSLHSRVATLANLPVDDLHLPVQIDFRSFEKHAINWMAEQGHRRVAVISNRLDTDFSFSRFQEGCLTRDMVCLKSHHFLLSPPFDSDSIIHLIKLLAGMPKKEGPDAILLSDASLLPDESALQNCLSENPTSLLARGYFPLSPKRQPSVVTHIGIDSQDLVLQIVDAMRNFQLERTSPDNIRLPYCRLDSGSSTPVPLEAGLTKS